MPKILLDSTGSKNSPNSREVYPVSRKGFLPPLAMDTTEAGFEFKVLLNQYKEYTQPV